jgi:hypothetical protein
VQVKQPGSAPAEFMCRLLRDGIDIEAVWSVGHSAEPDDDELGKNELLVFADRPTLERLRKCDGLRERDVALLVVTDGDSFENAWGEEHPSGSLARWAWREGTAGQVYYDESRWAAEPDEAGSVVRVRRKAYLVWSRTNSVPGT